ncbi:MAG TPA: arylamine N-acetyltransferase [Roseiflexaceae bacterium]|jgi:arylamine N-acetyltransferase|nr:arylamine N-acetyltransferase [Roseiflexaceae bacterium]
MNIRTERSHIDESLVHEVLALLGDHSSAPTLRRLNQLMSAYVRAVPWESAFRIARRAVTEQTTACVRWPAEFWRDAIERGGGGTCFESNYAFWSLLRALGYDGYLTINDMGQQRACHTAIIVLLDGSTYLVDVGIPMHCAVPLTPQATTRRRSGFHTYIARPAGEQRYEIERTRHPARNIYTLLDQPVPVVAYETAVEQDYGPNGLFLDRVIMTKIIDNVIWRFNSAEQPYMLESFTMAGVKQATPLPDEPAAMLAAHFGMDETAIATALDVVQRPRLRT